MPELTRSTATMGKPLAGHWSNPDWVMHGYQLGAGFDWVMQIEYQYGAIVDLVG